MKKDSKVSAKGNTEALTIRANNLKIIDLGLCTLSDCLSNNSLKPHSHGLAYVVGKADDDLIEKMYTALIAMGFRGQTETEFLPSEVFLRKYAVVK